MGILKGQYPQVIKSNEIKIRPKMNEILFMGSSIGFVFGKLLEGVNL